MLQNRSVLEVMVSYLGDIGPSAFLALEEITFVGLLAAGVFLAADVARDVQRLVSLLAASCTTQAASRQPSSWPSQREAAFLNVEENDAALRVRLLRVRQQSLHDVVVTTNTAHGGTNLCSLLVTVLEATVCVYTSISFLRRKIGAIHTAQSQERIGLALLWGVNLIIRFTVNCLLGQWLCNNVSV